MQLEYQSNTGDRRTVYNFGLVSAVADPTAVLTNEAEIEHAIFGGQ